MKRIRIKSRGILLAIPLILITSLKSQTQTLDFIQTNPADLADSRSFLLNPATISFHSAQLALGIKVLHMGFMTNDQYGFRQQYGGISYPGLVKGNLGLSITGQSFNSYYLSQTSFSIALSQAFLTRLAIGVRMRYFNNSYNQENTKDMIIRDDPVFANGFTKSALSYSAGFLILLMDNLSMGIAFDNINKPNISLGKDISFDPGARVPFATTVGFKYDFKSFGISTYFDYQDDKITSNFYVEYLFLGRAKFKVGYGMEAFKVETQLNLDRGVSINYHMDYPSNDLSKVSYGSHEMGVIYNLDWVMKSGFGVTSLVNTLEISRKSRTIRVDADVTETELKQITDQDLDVSSMNGELAMNEKYSELLNGVMPDSMTSTSLTNRYRESIDQVSSQLVDRKDTRVEIIVPEGTEGRAMTIKNRIINDWHISEEKVNIVVPVSPAHPDSTSSGENSSLVNEIIENRKSQQDQQLVIKEDYIDGITSDYTVFYVKHKYMKRPIKSWELIIENKDGKAIKAFTGWKIIPAEIPWDWLDDNYDFIISGVYYYYLRWQNANDQYQQTPRKMLNVIKKSRNTEIDLTRRSKESELKQGNKKVVKYQFKLNPENSK